MNERTADMDVLFDKTSVKWRWGSRRVGQGLGRALEDLYYGLNESKS